MSSFYVNKVGTSEKNMRKGVFYSYELRKLEH